MELPELRMCFADGGSLALELEQNLRHGRAFLSGQQAIEVLSECVLVLVHPDHGAELRLSAQVVMVNASGTGIALRGLTSEELAKLVAFAELLPTHPHPVPRTSIPPPPAADTLPPPPFAALMEPDLLAGSVEAPPEPEPAPVPEPDASSMPTCVPEAPSEASEPVQDDRPTVIPSGGEEGAELEAADHLPDDFDQPLDHEEELSCPEEGTASSTPPSRAPSTDLQAGASRQERLRNLNVAQQLKIARTGELADRVAVERLYGKQVWEALLHNPRLSIPEVARIARKGTVPKPLLDVILENAGWIKSDAVRRALLSNPKIGSEAVLKLLRATPRHELKMIERGTAYAAGVREAARKLLRQ